MGEGGTEDMRWLVRNPDAMHHTECPGQNLTEVTWARANLSVRQPTGANLTGAHLRLANPTTPISRTPTSPMP